jgi:hypothetical protein
MTMLLAAPFAGPRTSPSPPVLLRCVACAQALDVQSGGAAVILRHVAYAFGFVHQGACEAAALDSVFVEPGYDCAAYAHDRQRRRLLAAKAADDLRWCAVVEYADGSERTENIVWDTEWLDEPGAAEFVSQPGD